jgi:hypothetical protein
MTQHVTQANEHNWCMKKDNHQLTGWGRSLDIGEASLEIRKCSDDSLDICASETGKRTKLISINLKPETVQSLRKFLNGAKKPPLNILAAG